MKLQSNLAISNSVNSKSPLFRRKIECPWIYPSPLRSPGYFEAPLFRTFFYFPWDFEIAGFDCIMRSKFFFLFVGRQPTTWPANNCLQIMVCSCAIPFNCVWLQIIFCTCVKETVLFSFLRSLLRENGRSLRFPRIFIKKANSVIEW